MSGKGVFTMTKRTTSALFSTWQGGDQEAGPIFWERIEGRIKSLLRIRKSLLKPGTRPSDLVQDVYLDLFVAAERGKLEGVRDIRAFAAKILNNKIVDANRQDQRRRLNLTPQSSSQGQGGPPARPAHSPNVRLQWLEYLEQVHRIFETLDDRETIIVSMMLANVRQVDIASQLGCSPEALAKTWHRTLRPKLARQLKKAGLDSSILDDPEGLR